MSELFLFEQKQVRRVRHGKAWWFVIVDVIAALIDSANPSDYLKKLRKCEPFLSEAFKGGKLCPPSARRSRFPGSPEVPDNLPGTAQHLNPAVIEAAL